MLGLRWFRVVFSFFFLPPLCKPFIVLDMICQVILLIYFLSVLYFHLLTFVGDTLCLTLWRMSYETYTKHIQTLMHACKHSSWKVKRQTKCGCVRACMFCDVFVFSCMAFLASSWVKCSEAQYLHFSTLSKVLYLAQVPRATSELFICTQHHTFKHKTQQLRFSYVDMMRRIQLTFFSFSYFCFPLCNTNLFFSVGKKQSQRSSKLFVPSFILWLWCQCFFVFVSGVGVEVVGMCGFRAGRTLTTGQLAGTTTTRTTAHIPMLPSEYCLSQKNRKILQNAARHCLNQKNPKILLRSARLTV